MKLNEDGELNENQLLIIRNAMVYAGTRYRNFARYYIGDNPTIKDATARQTPDNRVPCPFGKKLVDTMKGYMFKPGYITYKTEGDYINTLKDIFDYNDEELKTAEQATDALVNGESYELLRVTEDAKMIKFYRVLPGTGFPVYDDTLDHNLIAFVHYVENELESTNELLEQVQGIEAISTSTGSPSYTRTIYYKDFFVVSESTDGKKWTEIDRKDHPFEDVPVVVYNISLDRLPLFNAVLPLIDEHDKIISSNYANDMERFANAYLLVLKKIDNIIKDENGKTDAEKIAEIRMFDDLGRNGDINNAANAVSFLTKPSRGTDVAESADRFSELIYDLSMVINPNDPAFGTASGIALRYKLLPMEFKATDIQSYFTQGLQKRIELIGNAKKIHGGNPEPVTITYKRNLPYDIDTLAITAGNLKGIISDKSILSLFPADIVPNVDAELAEMEARIVLPEAEEPEEPGEVDDDSPNAT